MTHKQRNKRTPLLYDYMAFVKNREFSLSGKKEPFSRKAKRNGYHKVLKITVTS